MLLPAQEKVVWEWKETNESEREKLLGKFLPGLTAWYGGRRTKAKEKVIHLCAIHICVLYKHLILQ